MWKEINDPRHFTWSKKWLRLLIQVEESIKYACVGDRCDPSEFVDVLQEMDRRYFLIEHLRWEFSMLDPNMSDTISEEQAK